MKPDSKRWLVVLAGILANMCQGSAYAFSVYAPHLGQHLKCTKPQLALAFSFSLAFLPIGMILSGKIADTKGPKFVVLVGGLLFSLGLFMAGFTNSLPWLYVTYGVMMSVGGGAFYGAAIGAAVRWFPDRRGLASGLVVSALGLGSLVIPPLANMMITDLGILTTFKILGTVFAGVILITFSFLNNPPAGYLPECYTPPAATAATVSEGLRWTEMIGKPLFYLLFVLYAMGAFTGLMIISQAMSIALEITQLLPAAAALAVGILGGANAAGRLIWGAVSDKIGRIRSLSLMFAITAIVMFAMMPLASGGMISLLVALVLVGLCYGGYLGVFPSICADAFGSKNLAMNYAVLFFSFSVAGITAPRVAAKIRESSGSYEQAFLVAGIICVAGFLVSLVTKIRKK